MIFIGDVHGNFHRYKKLVESMQAMNESSFQVGDLGVFAHDDLVNVPQLSKQKVMRGNHDNPFVFKVMSNALSDFGHHARSEMFWLAGGYSIDQDTRTLGVDYWDDEEISYSSMMEAIELYRQTMPRIMVSHECPSSFMPSCIRHNIIPSRTAVCLDAMLDLHKPEIWVFGHHHRRIDERFKSVRMVGLGSFNHCETITECLFKIPGVDWQ